MNKNNYLEFIVKREDTGKKVEDALKKKFDISSSLFTYLKLNGKIFLNGKICRSIDIVSENDVVSADISENLISDIPEYDIKIKIFYEDEHILVTEKPSGLSMHPCINNYEKTFAGAVIKHFRNSKEEHLFHAVNRLDKDTSGICLIAKNRYSHSILSKQAKNSIIKKEYKAVVHGKIEKEGVIDLPIDREEEGILKRKVIATGKKAVTEYIPEIYTDNFSLLKISLKTGRTHQIRVHFSHIGHPLYGDWLYGSGDEEKSLIVRQALHSYSISFIHPVTKEHMNFTSDLPEDITNLLNKLS